MIPDPLHPAIVHFPIVIAMLLPIFIGGTLWAIRRGARPRRAWLLPVGLSAAMALSAWVAVQTGEAQDERVERVVGERALETHEESAEAFLLISGGVLLVAAGGLLGGIPGRVARGATLAAALIAIGGVVRTGQSGGKLVYQHGAANAYVPTAGTNAPGQPLRNREADDDDGKDTRISSLAR